jgi:hypothetical protein
MAQFNEPTRTQVLWAAVLREAAGPLSAYITPSSLSLENVSVEGLLDSPENDFEAEIEARLDFGRAAAFLQLLRESELAVSSAYRHVLSWSDGAIRGKIHVPRYVLGLARKERRGIPVIVARREVTTPENVLVSEALRLCIAAVEGWKRRSGAEEYYATTLWNGLQAFESSFPWNELRTKARPSLSELVGVVEGRLRAGQVEPGSFYEKTASLFSERPDNLTAFVQAATPISMMLTQSPEFEDRVFELLCVAWVILALRAICLDVQVHPIALRGPRKGPIAVGKLGDREVALFYQQSAGLLPAPTWIYRHSQQALRAIPDLVLRLTEGHSEQFVIVDAKNRTYASESEVAYKLMGYRENLELRPFHAIGLYPGFSGKLRVRRLEKAEDRICLIHIPLAEGSVTVRRLARCFLGQQIEASVA